MRRVLLITWCFGLMACSDAFIDVPGVVDLGTVRVGQSASQALTITNLTDDVMSLQLEVDRSEFFINAGSLMLNPHQSQTVDVEFNAATTGIVFANLKISSQRQKRTVRLTATGVGSSLVTAARIELPLSVIVPGEVDPVRGELTVANLVEGRATRRVLSIDIEGEGLCIGRENPCDGFDGQTLEPGQTLRLLLEATLTGEGTRSWVVTLHTDDPLQPTLTTLVTASAEALIPCDFQLPSPLLLTSVSNTISLVHGGTKACLLRAIDLRSAIPGAVRIQTIPTVPIRLEPQAEVLLRIELLDMTVRQAVLEISTPGSPVRTIDVIFAGGAFGCIRTEPPTLSFENVIATCAGERKTLVLRNYCAEGLRVTLETDDSTASAVFTVVDAGSEVVVPALGSTAIGVLFNPQATGPRIGGLTSSYGDTQFFTPLHGVGVLGDRVEHFPLPQRPATDLIVVIDRSWESPGIFQGPWLNQQFQSLAAGCRDVNVAFVAAEGAPLANFDFARDDAGQAFISADEPDFALRASTRLYSMPFSSEVESCVAPLERVIPTAPLRAGVPLSVLCVSTALEQTPDAGPRLQSIADTIDAGFRFDAVVASEHSMCTIESSDDGTWSQLAREHGGVVGDVCSLPAQGDPAFGCISRVTLGNRVLQLLEVAWDGVTVEPFGTDGGAQWSFASFSNEIVLNPPALRGVGEVSVRYTSCAH